ncbi:hypothetical protein A3J20_06380 [Candidatus Gottesmanbacteria bacterium RIFCSPLOWO2_02_FULL_42_29]|uniref:Cohesin domain-containing protein n=2 Tax=Candidatus Gottesmaniibacteriota TaxID=1752720 RepID=A0A1F6BIB3_9BACT|nr:MAG: hypothetical protein UV09_C0001G0046 [Candidatus Gottesmanbacteria bacterium GW2011_GWA2_42_18]OGG11188.1 MAG: hypothetical protein A2781_05375 [Candidatus Gottesmanbacteria bacterium RIFCSPHIGHO2_01_FULL_42_27]OGG21280.1 MAG: hypothetical protein A3E72_05115 [Candidatus Gottesmanbacteria bacterium RIFCSPHIGHO2_12_FULL_43_26]OGG32804.1 MAG: hypothetical protein A3G68_05965 [Candidatus Gottesmanbacteria bacterium RIFCSPLOWO2_12_FULL_42_10]OGG36267.1 MAG: hypothetical protein A2968_04410 
MISSLPRNKLLALFIVLGLLAVLPMVIYLAMTRQDLRNRAAGSDEVGIRFSPTNIYKTEGETFDVSVNTYKIADRSIKASGVQVKLSVDDSFSINSAKCSEPFDGVPFTKIDGQSVTVICAISPASDPVDLTADDLPFAQINLTLNTPSHEGPLEIIIESTRVTEAGVAGQAPDVSTTGENATFKLATAAIGEAQILFEPAESVLPPDRDMKIMLNAGRFQIAFTRIVLKFNPSKLNLASEITPNPALSNIVEKTSMQQANSSGEAVFVVAASPTDSLPTGYFELASFKVKSVSQIANDNAAIDFLPNTMQVVESGSALLNTVRSPATFVMNTDSVSVSPPISKPIPPRENPCLDMTSDACYQQWIYEFTTVFNTTYADFNQDGTVNLIDYEIWRRTKYP